MQAAGQQQRPGGNRANNSSASALFDLAACGLMAVTSGLCRPSSSKTPAVILAKAARPRRVLALRMVALICGVLVRLNCVPSSATNRQPRQNASA